jgi:hypothetical protein
MKIRIKGNSIRFRLSKSEVARLENTGYLEEQTSFGENKFSYALQRMNGANQLSAKFDGGQITVYVPERLVQNWSVNGIVGFDASMPLTATDSLYILIEKDFVCLDETAEDQNDNYENPNKTC